MLRQLSDRLLFVENELRRLSIHEARENDADVDRQDQRRAWWQSELRHGHEFVNDERTQNHRSVVPRWLER